MSTSYHRAVFRIFPVLTSIVVKEAYVSVLVSCDCEGEGGVTYYFVDLS